MSRPSGSRREPAEAERNEVWAKVGGQRVHGVYSTADGWVEVIADNGLTKTARCGDSSAPQVAERLLRELYRGALTRPDRAGKGRSRTPRR